MGGEGTQRNPNDFAFAIDILNCMPFFQVLPGDHKTTSTCTTELFFEYH